MSFRILNQAPQYLLPDGRVNAGGSLTFYETDLTTLKDTWSDEALSTLNSNPVQLNASGQTNTDVWGNGEYGVVCKDALGTILWTRNNVRDVANPGSSIPPLVSGQFLTNDGSVMSWAPVLQVPDPTGSTGYVLSNDGINPTWIPQPTIPDLPVENFSNRVKIGTLLIQWGSSSAPASGSRQTGASVTFANAFSDTPYYVGVTPSNYSHTAGGQIGVPAVHSKSATGFSVHFDTDDFGQTNASFIAAEPFDWVAFGPTTA